MRSVLTYVTRASDVFFLLSRQETHAAFVAGGMETSVSSPSLCALDVPDASYSSRNSLSSEPSEYITMKKQNSSPYASSQGKMFTSTQNASATGFTSMV